MADRLPPDPVPALRFSKMHGAGNDFVILDLRGGAATPAPALCRALADRHTGVGCDQILTIESPRSHDAVASYRIWNADGSPSQQCGNGARCVAAWLVRDGAAGGRRSRSTARPARMPSRRWAMAPTGWRWACRTSRRRRSRWRASTTSATNTMPCSTTNRSCASARCRWATRMRWSRSRASTTCRSRVSATPCSSRRTFPESANVGFAEVVARDRIRLRVYERGVGETLACGSGACAAVAVLARRGRVDRAVTVSLPGGDLRIEWPDDDAQVAMAGPDGIRLRRGVVAMSDTTEKLGAHEIAAWLRRHPKFLQQFPDLAISMVVPREEGPAASLASYQLEVLRDKNRELTQRLHDLYTIAQDNERLSVQTQQLTLTLLRAGHRRRHRAGDGRQAQRGFQRRPGAGRAVRAGGGAGRRRLAAGHPAGRRRCWHRSATASPRASRCADACIRTSRRCCMARASTKSSPARCCRSMASAWSRSAAASRTASIPAWARCSCA